MRDESEECPLCASRNVSYSEREKAIICRDCGTVVTGTPVKIDLPREEAREVIIEVPRKLAIKPIKKKILKKKAKPKKKAKAKPKKKTKRKPAKKAKPKPKKKGGLLKRLLRRR